MGAETFSLGRLARAFAMAAIGAAGAWAAAAGGDPPKPAVGIGASVADPRSRELRDRSGTGVGASFFAEWAFKRANCKTPVLQFQRSW
jgi:hypothetical protein